MTEDFHNANNALKFLQGKGIDTSAGRVFLASDVEAALRARDEQRLDAAIAPQPKTMAQAKRLVRQDEALMKQMKGESKTEIGGPSVQAGPDPSSRT